MVSHQRVFTLVLSIVLLGLPSLTFGVTFHLRPTSTNMSCSTSLQSCYTLLEYARNHKLYFNSSTLALQFLPGNHTLDVNLNITSIQQVKIFSNSSAVVPSKIVCSSNVGITLSNISKVKIDGLTFVSCAKFRVQQLPNDRRFTTYYGLHLQSVQIAKITDCTFQDSYGSAFGVVNSHVVLRRNRFLGNCKMCQIRQCPPIVGDQSCYGGGIFVDRSNLSISGSSSYIDNSADWGGGVYVQKNSNVNIRGNTTFIGNSAEYGGGVHIGSNSNVKIMGNTTFSRNSASTYGGGVYTGSNSNVEIMGYTTFSGNSAKLYGGGVYETSNSTLNIGENVTFRGNSAIFGGGIYAHSKTNVTISGNAALIGNTADYGGGVFSSSNTIVLSSGNTTFINNSARSCGGGIHVESNSMLSISENTMFNGNFATDYGNGGGVCAEFNTNVDIKESTKFIGNSAKSNGGVVYTLGNININISGNTTFIGNSAQNGGVIYAKPHSKLSISGNPIFRANSASQNGGVVAGLNTYINVSGNTTFIGNSAKQDGGGVCSLSNGNISIMDNITLFSNSAGTGGGIHATLSSTVNISGNAVFSGNSASIDGGAIYAVSNTNVDISGNTAFKGNSAKHSGGCINVVDTALNIQGNGSFTNCSARNGGAIYIKDTQVTLNGTNVFCANRATNVGGGIYSHKSSLTLPGDITFTANLVESRGGAIYAEETAMRLNGTVLLIANVAQLDGGGLYADGSDLNFSGSIKLSNNTAELGGGVYSDNNTFNINGHTDLELNAAIYYGGSIYIRRTSFTLTGNNTFIANSAGEGGGIYAEANSTLVLTGLNFFTSNTAHVSGGGIWLDHSNLVLDGCNHFVECAASYEGGAIFTYAATVSLPGNNTFESNSATAGGGIHARWSKILFAKSSDFKYNTAVFGGGIYTDNSTFELNGSSTFTRNQANYTGGAVYAARSIMNFLGTSSLTATLNHAARDGGGMYTRDNCVINLLGLSNYQNNSAEDTGGGISAFWSSFNIAGQNIFESNNAGEGGGFYAVHCSVTFSGENAFTANSASIHGGGSAVLQSKLQLNGSATFRSNSAAKGGALYLSDSSADINGSNCFKNNIAESGGGMYTRNSTVQANGKTMFEANSAQSKGAAIYTLFTTLTLKGGSYFVNNSAEYGGGIHSEITKLEFLHDRSSHPAIVLPLCTNYKNCNEVSTPNEIVFLNNSALRGGAQYFDLHSNLSLNQTAHVCFQNNHATEFGGALYVADMPMPNQLLSWQHESFRNECFIHILTSFHENPSPLTFVNNTAGIRGSVLYGGLLDKCDSPPDSYTSVLQLFNMSILQRENDKGHSISSNPSHLCFCNMTAVNCTAVSQSRSIYPGQQVEVSAAAVDQSGLIVPALIFTELCSDYNLNMSETRSYESGENCTSRKYLTTPKKLFNRLVLYPSNWSTSSVHLTVNIIFKPCPVGFEPSNFTGECICDHRISEWPFTNSCSVDRQAILRKTNSTFWLNVSYNNGTPDGFIYHPFCPLDYCTSESKYFNLYNPDEQCDYNRSGLLCGKCKEGLSLVLGSSQCQQCSNNYLFLLIPFALAGILLVVLLFLLHLTVAAGTLHGLIFYANIVAANHHIFFPHTSNNPASIFIAWLNLDLGIQTCFYDGMDVYAKTWLEFAFPVYIWMIVGFLIYISGRSVTTTKLLGSSPVPVLATLFLFSYAKILRSTIAALSATILHYPNENVLVWIHDANVSLTKYIPLAVIALVFLLFLFLPYTLLLLSGQWLQHKSHFCLLSWVNNPKLKAILDPYYAPYKPKYRYWTGFLLVVRCALFLVFAFNISGDDNINLLVISSTTSGIFGWLTLSGLVYKSWYLNALEVSFILNLSVLTVATYYVKQSDRHQGQAAVVYTSVGIAFLTFVGIIIYHIFMQIKTKVQYMKCKWKNHSRVNNTRNVRNIQYQFKNNPTVTYTEVNLNELQSSFDLLRTN